MNEPLFSVVIPCYNAEQFIQDTIYSVLNQSYSNIEIIIVNDGSTDNSLAKIKEIQNNKIQIINKTNSGVSDSRNIGFEKSTGEYILFLDSDDVISKNYFSSALEGFQKHQEIDFCTFHIQHFDNNNQQLLLNADKRGTFQNIQKEVAGFNPVISTCPSAYIYKKEFLNRNSIRYSKKLNSPADKYFLMEVGKFGKGFLIETGAAHLLYRINQNSMSNKITEKLLKEQELFYIETIKNKILKTDIEKLFTKKMTYQLISTFIRLKDYKRALKYSIIYAKQYL